MKSKLLVKIPSETMQQLDELVKHYKYPSLEPLLVNITNILWKYYKQEKISYNELNIEKIKDSENIGVNS